MNLKVHIPEQYEPDMFDELRVRLHPSVELTTGASLPVPAEYQVLVAGLPTKADLEASPHLDTLIIPWAGVPKRTLALAREYPHIGVYNLHHNATPVAEMAMALMLAATKWLIPIDRALRADDWSARSADNICLLLEGRTALILGYGAIGRKIGRMCFGFGMRVLAIRRQATGNRDGEAMVYPPEKLRELLPRADVLFIAVPNTPETRQMIGEKELALLPAGATVVNIARGAIVDEKALYDNLARNRLRAGLDVWYNYPSDETGEKRTPPSHYPFHELDNVVMTPHLGFKSDLTDALRVRELADLLNALADGKRPANKVDLSREY